MISTAITEYTEIFWRRYFSLMDTVLQGTVAIDNGGLRYARTTGD